MHSLLLKAGAACLTVLAVVGSAAYVSGHVKNGGAPLHPSVVGGSKVVSAAADGKLVLTPSVKRGNVTPVTSTYAS